MLIKYCLRNMHLFKAPPYMLAFSVKCVLCMTDNFREHGLKVCNASGTVRFANVEQCTGCAC